MRLEIRETMNILTVSALLLQLAKNGLTDLEIVLDGTPDSCRAMQKAINEVFKDSSNKPRFVAANTPHRTFQTHLKNWKTAYHSEKLGQRNFGIKIELSVS